MIGVACHLTATLRIPRSLTEKMFIVSSVKGEFMRSILRAMNSGTMKSVQGLIRPSGVLLRALCYLKIC